MESPSDFRETLEQKATKGALQRYVREAAARGFPYAPDEREKREWAAESVEGDPLFEAYLEPRLKEFYFALVEEERRVLLAKASCKPMLYRVLSEVLPEQTADDLLPEEWDLKQPLEAMYRFPFLCSKQERSELLRRARNEDEFMGALLPAIEANYFHLERQERVGLIHTKAFQPVFHQWLPRLLKEGFAHLLPEEIEIALNGPHHQEVVAKAVEAFDRCIELLRDPPNTESESGRKQLDAARSYAQRIGKHRTFQPLIQKKLESYGPQSLSLARAVLGNAA